MPIGFGRPSSANSPKLTTVAISDAATSRMPPTRTNPIVVMTTLVSALAAQLRGEGAHLRTP